MNKMNKLEQRVAWELEALKRNGKIKSWQRGKPTLLAVRSLRTGRKITYTPDFFVKLSGNRNIVIEVKGPHLREDSYLKFEWMRQSCCRGWFFVWFEPSRSGFPKTIEKALASFLEKQADEA